MKAKNKPARAGGVHLIGICGKGVSGLAIMLKEKGWQVSGSDSGFYDPVYSMLKRNKIKVQSGYHSANIPKDVDMIVTGGKFANFLPEKNEEVRAALAMNKKLYSVPEVLAELFAKTDNTVIAGSFGKSTTTALLSWCLISARKDPSYFIGAVPLGFKTNAHTGTSKQFICEGDEYPSSNWDTTSKFLHLKPKNLIFISALHDHVNVFPKESDYIKPYTRLVTLLPANGLLVASGDGKNVSKIIKKAKCKTVTYSLTKKSLWHSENIAYGVKTTFDLHKGTKKITTLQTSLLGNHDIENIVGVSAFLLEKKLVTIAELQKGIKTFKGLSGRIDLKATRSLVPIYEGFGSSYIKAKSVFDALQLHFPSKKITAVFEPHSSSWSNALAKEWYKDIFQDVEKIVILPPPPHRTKAPNQMTFEEIVTEVKKHNQQVYTAATEKEALAVIKKITKKDDIIALISSGSLLGLSKSIPKMFEKKVS